MVEEPRRLPLEIMASHPGSVHEFHRLRPISSFSRGCHSLSDQSDGSENVSVSSLGGNCREYYTTRKESSQSIARNFFCIGTMVYVYALGHGVRVGFTSGRFFCIHGKGSFLMHAEELCVAVKSPFGSKKRTSWLLCGATACIRPIEIGDFAFNYSPLLPSTVCWRT